MPYEFDITIVGGGCIGLSILHALVTRGQKNIALLDFGRKSLSATASSGGMVRVFHEHPKHVDLALGNFAWLSEYRRKVSQPKGAGSLYFMDHRRLSSLRENLRQMELAQYPFEVLDHEAGRARFPQFRWQENDCAIFEPLGGHLSPNQFCEELLVSSVGAAVFDDFEVQRISCYRNRFRLCGPDYGVTTKTLVLAGGARLLPRLKDLGVQLPLQTKLLTVHRAALRGEPLPNYFDRETLSYARLGAESEAIFATPECRRLIAPPWYGPSEENSAEDCYAPQRIGYSGQVSGIPNLFMATGWGGTGFKFALEIGHRIAKQLTHKAQENIYA